MFFRQFYLGCLAHASYLIGDGGEAAVVDPRRESGYRSSIAGSLLLHRRGAEPINVVGGTSAWIAAGYPTEKLPV